MKEARLTPTPWERSTELNAATGAFVRVLQAPGADLSSPTAIAISGSTVWVTKFQGNSGAVEFDGSDGAFVRDIGVGGADSIHGPEGLVATDGKVWIDNEIKIESNGLITVLDAASGRLVRVINAAPSVNASAGSGGIVADDDFVWASYDDNDEADNSVSIFNAATLEYIRTFNGAVGAYFPSNDLAVDGNNLWVTESQGPGLEEGGVTELNRMTGSVIRTMGASSDGFNNPQQIVVAGNHVWIANQDGNSVIELSTSTGKLVKVIS
jgi:outer membrane protein assembly factor BamB